MKFLLYANIINGALMMISHIRKAIIRVHILTMAPFIHSVAGNGKVIRLSSPDRPSSEVD